MIKKSGSVFVTALIMAASLALLPGCAENVSQRVDVVKSDLAKLTQLLGQPLSGGVSVMAKASSVIATSTYEGDVASEVKKVVGNLLPSLGYQLSLSEKPRNSQTIFCHKNEAGRSVLIEDVPGSPRMTTISVSISGWKQDKERCPGNYAG